MLFYVAAWAPYAAAIARGVLIAGLQRAITWSRRTA